MDSLQTPTLAVGLLALAASVVMVWRVAGRQRAVPEAEKPRQFRRFTRRRLVMSALVGLVGVALVASTFLSRDWYVAHPLDITIFWLGVIAALIVLLGLCVADVYAVLYDQISAHYKSENWTDVTGKTGPKAKPRA